MPRYSLSTEEVLEEDLAVDEVEPPHPVGFGAQWRRTWIGLDPPLRALLLPSSERCGSTYAIQDQTFGETDEEYLFASKLEQRYPPLSSYIPSDKASTAALLKYRHSDVDNSPRHHQDNTDILDDDMEMLNNLFKTLSYNKTLPVLTSPSKPLPTFSDTNRHIQQKLAQERMKMEQEHQEATQQMQIIVTQLENEAGAILKERKRQQEKEEEAAAALARQQQQQQEEEENRQRKEDEDRRHDEEKREKEQQEARDKKEEEQQRSKQEKIALLKKQQEAAKSKDYVAKAKKLVMQLVAVRESIEPFDNNKAVSKRRLGMKKVVRGKINTLSENAQKIKEVAADVSQAISEARTEDERIKKALVQKDPGYTPDMARGKRYLVDLLASNAIQRVQAEGFNGPRGDGFPLANMLAMVSVENEELVPILAAHIYTVCPTAIPTLPTPAPDASEEELMSSLGMLKDKNGEYETFDRFLTRTESIVALVADIMASFPQSHLLMGGSKGATTWLSRFLDLLPLSETTTLPLLTAPVLFGFLSGAGHMLANKYTEVFQKQLEIITTKVLSRLDEGPIGKPSSIRLGKLVEGGLEAFKSTLPSKALPELYVGAQPQASGGAHGATAPASSFGGPSSVSSNPFGSSSSTSNTPFGSSSSPWGNSSSSQTGNTSGNPFGKAAGPGTAFGATASSAQPNPFGGGGSMNSSGGSGTPFGGGSGSAPPTNAFGSGGPTAAPSPFGASSSAGPSPFGSAPAPSPSPFGATPSAAPAPFGAAAPSPFGAAPLTGQSPFGAAPSSNPSPFGAASTASATPFGSAPSTGPSPFGASAAPSPFGAASNSGPSPFGAAPSSNPSPFGAAPSSGPLPFGSAPSSNPSPFGAASSTPFGSAAPSPFGGGPSTFGSSSGNMNTNSSPFGAPRGQQSTPFGGNPSTNQGNNKNNNNRGKPPCKFFAQGRCKFGDSCKFSHETGGGGNNFGNKGGGFGSNTWR